MATRKKNTSIWIEPEVNRKLRIISAYTGKRIGDVIKNLLVLVDDQGRVIVGQKRMEEPNK